MDAGAATGRERQGHPRNRRPLALMWELRVRAGPISGPVLVALVKTPRSSAMTPSSFSISGSSVIILEGEAGALLRGTEAGAYLDYDQAR